MSTSASERVRAWIRYAQDALRRGNLALAESLAGDALGAGGPNADALVVVAEVALRVKRPDCARAWARAALDLQPDRAEARDQLARAEAALPHDRPEHAQPGERYLVATAWGHGLWSDVDSVVGALLLAEMTGRRPVVYWGPDSKYAAAGAGNAWTDYFEPIGSDALEAALTAIDRQSVYPGKWTRDRLLKGSHERLETQPVPTGVNVFNRPEDVVVCDVHTALIGLLPWIPAGHRLHGAPLKTAYRELVRQSVRPRAEIAREAEAFARERLGVGSEAPVLAVHYRGSDKPLEDPDAVRVQSLYARYVDHFAAEFPGGRIFLLTDSEPTLRAYRERYGERVVTTDSTRTDKSVGLHFQALPDRRRLAVEVIRDVLIAASCDLFLGFAYSNVSCFVEFFKDWPEGSSHLLGTYVLGSSDAMLMIEPAVKARMLSGLPPLGA